MSNSPWEGPSRGLLALLTVVVAIGATACGSQESAPTSPGEETASPSATPSAPAPRQGGGGAGVAATPDDLPRALVLGLAQFVEPKSKGAPPEPGAARLDFLVRRGGEWSLAVLEDPESNVFHKAMVYQAPGQEPKLLTVSGSKAAVKLWSPGASGLEAKTLWTKDFGGKFSRMRDVEIADLYGDGKSAMAVATHDQGVVAILRPDDDGGFSVEEIDAQENIFVHEIEIGDIDGDGVLEVYATPSEPNRLDGSVQTGQVARYVPATGEGRKVVADLKDRHAKEIYVGDVDGDGSDELYVVVEGHVGEDRQLIHGVEVRRYEAGTDPGEGAVIAEVRDRLARFLTVGDIDGDGKKEMVLAAFSSGLWLLRPPDDPNAAWSVTSIDRDSGGFEHASILTDLDGDGKDELYTASDKHKEVRRYVWDGTRMVREVIFVRPDNRAIFTWNLMPVPISLVPAS